MLCVGWSNCMGLGHADDRATQLSRRSTYALCSARLMQAAIASACAMQSCYLDTVGTATSYDVNDRAYYAQVSTPAARCCRVPCWLVASTRTVPASQRNEPHCCCAA